MCERVRESRRETDKSGKRINKIYRRKREKERGKEKEAHFMQKVGVGLSN